MDTSLFDWVIGRYWVQMILVIICLVWALFDPDSQSYEPPHINLEILDSIKWKFAVPDYEPTSVGEEIWLLGINRNLIQLETMKKPTGPLWKTMDSLLD